jgi:hypothetical protein
MNSSDSSYGSSVIPWSAVLDDMPLQSADHRGPMHFPSSLAVVPLEGILIHEMHDPTRAGPLAEAIARDGVLRHPVILAYNRYGPPVHLDGANRITALQQLGCRHVAAQMVDYDDPAAVRLETWLHLTCLSRAGLLEAAEGWPQCEVEGLRAERAVEMMAQGRATAMVLFENGEAFILLTSMGLADRVETMRQLTELYAAHIIREVLPRNDPLAGMRELLISNSHQANACVGFAPLSKGDVITLAWNMGTQLPAGITRHIITCGRILNVNVPLSLLQADLPAGEKTVRLKKMLACRRRRVYHEPTIVYEDY